MPPFANLEKGETVQDSCSDVLQKTEVNRMDSTMLRTAYLITINNEESFNSAKQASGGLSAIFDDIPASATLN